MTLCALPQQTRRTDTADTNQANNMVDFEPNTHKNSTEN